MKRMMMALAAAGALGAAVPVAALTYTVAGSFRANDGASFRTLLGGGSFDGSFVLNGSSFPTTGTTNFVSYSINLRDSKGAVVAVLSQAPGGAGGYISGSASTQSAYGGNALNFYELSGGQFAKSLFLVVPTDFNGTGGIVAKSSSTASVMVSTVRQEATVTTASIGVQGAVGVVPEPASWALMLAGVGAAGVALRRRTARVRLAAAAAAPTA